MQNERINDVHASINNYLIRYKEYHILIIMQNYKRLNQNKEFNRINNQLMSLMSSLYKIRSRKYTNHSLQMEFNARRKVDKIRHQLQLSKMNW
jgi:hypothetical protein